METPNYPYVAADDLGPARSYDLYAKSNPRDTQREMHFTVKLRNQDGGFTHRPNGWLTRNAVTDQFTNRLFDDNRANQSIEFIEWSDRMNCVVRDGIYISRTNFYMTKHEFSKFAERITESSAIHP